MKKRIAFIISFLAICTLISLLIPNRHDAANALTIEDKFQTVKAMLANLQTALEVYKRDVGSYPTAEEGLKMLVPNNNSINYPKGYRKAGYLKKVPKDPWNHDFEYFQPRKGILYICSPGAYEQVGVVVCRTLNNA